MLIFLLFYLFSKSIKDNDIIETFSPITSTPNMLLIITDDLGKYAINWISQGSIKPSTPNKDVIRNYGISFSNFWTNLTRSPTRDSIITGKYDYRTD